MSFLSGIIGRGQNVVPQKQEKLANRFIGDGGFMQMGATFHAPRTNSSEEIIASLKLLAKCEREKAEKGRKNLLEEVKNSGYDFEKQAKENNRDIVDIVIQKQNAYTAELNEKISKGFRLTKDDRAEHAKLSKLCRCAVGIKTAELKAREITEFLSIAGDMPQRHLSLAHDVVDLSNTHAMINTDIFPTVDYNTIGQVKNTNKKTTLMGYVLNLLPRLSKANPKAVDLAEAVVSHSDDTNAKFFLHKFVDSFHFIGTEKQAEATEPLVENLSKSVLKGMPSMDLGANCKEQIFYNLISNLCKVDSKPENIKLLKQTMDITDTVAPEVDANIDLDDIRLGDTEKIAENIEILPKVLENVKGSAEFDVSGFLTKNVNLS